MKVGVPAEVRDGERRVALVPDAVGRLVAAGLEVAVETAAGERAFITDQAFRDAGAEVVDGPVLAGCDVVASV
ncbi:MAG: H+-translocating transhydrogenase subunit alpha, partial [Actinomycetota bacterium]|nr:H+-translocating transhydrogenase subunit alpha [Actinomycetota bacterium]